MRTIESIIPDELSMATVGILESKNTDTRFLTLNTLAKASQSGSGIIIISLRKTRKEYEQLLRRLGVNNFSNIVFISSIVDSKDDIYAPPADENYFERISSVFADCDESFKHRACVFIDDVLDLAHLGWEKSSIIAGLLSIRDSVYQHQGALLIGTKLYKSHERLHKAILHFCDYVLMVNNLNTGRSNEIDGQITTMFGPFEPFRNNFNPHSLHFKIIENSVKLIAPGLSSGTL